jgi:hypothetical protein
MSCGSFDVPTPLLRDRQRDQILLSDFPHGNDALRRGVGNTNHPCEVIVVRVIVLDEIRLDVLVQFDDTVTLVERSGLGFKAVLGGYGLVTDNQIPQATRKRPHVFGLIVAAPGPTGIGSKIPARLSWEKLPRVPLT